MLVDYIRVGSRRNIFSIILFLLACFAVNSANTATRDSVTDIYSDYPVHFVGQLPGANCESQYQIDLLKDHVFFFRYRCIKNNQGIDSDDIGRWFIDTEKNQLVLKGGREQPLHFSIIDEETIEKLDNAGNKIESSLNYQLKASQSVKTLEPQVFMEGMYQYMADAALFRECITGLKLPVLFEKDHLALEKAYNRDKKAAGAMLKVHLEGQIVQRPRMEGGSLQAHLQVERFIQTLPNEHCGNQYVDASLENTYWKLTALNGKPISIQSDIREPHIIFRTPADGRKTINGTTGCNTIVGDYESDNKQITISPQHVLMIGVTCLESDLEQRFLSALTSSVNWKIKGDHLELLGASSTRLARFEAVYF